MKKRFIPALFLIPFLLFGCDTSNKNSGESPIEVQKYAIHIVPNERCTITTSKTEASRNEVVEVFVTNIARGYSVSKITANGRKIDNAKFIMPNEEVTIEVFLKRTDGGEEGNNKITVVPSEYALISLDKESYDANETVQIHYQCKGNYILTHFLVNGQPITGTSFVMPDEDVEIEGVFECVFKDTDWVVNCIAGGLEARTFFYFSYEEEGIRAIIKCDDHILSGKEYASSVANRDNVEFIFGVKTDYNGWKAHETMKFLASCDGGVLLQRAQNNTSWDANLVGSLEPEEFSCTVQERSTTRNEGYNGYEVDVFISYSLLYTYYEECVGNITICPAMRNRTLYNCSEWNFYGGSTCIWEKVSTHPILLEDGSLKERS